MEMNVKKVMQSLREVGFPEDLEWTIQVHFCFYPQKFVVPFCQLRGPDQLRYQILIAHGESGQYTPLYYDACLIRQIEIHPNDACADLVDLLKQQMQVVNWEDLLQKTEGATIEDLSELKMVQQVNAQLKELQQLDGGDYYADLLKMRYWSRSPFEIYSAAGSQIRSAYEVCQRFHFFDDGGGITLDEAYRFLLHRWREKQLQLYQRSEKRMNSIKNSSKSKM